MTLFVALTPWSPAATLASIIRAGSDDVRAPLLRMNSKNWLLIEQSTGAGVNSGSDGI